MNLYGPSHKVVYCPPTGKACFAQAQVEVVIPNTTVRMVRVSKLSPFGDTMPEEARRVKQFHDINLSRSLDCSGDGQSSFVAAVGRCHACALARRITTTPCGESPRKPFPSGASNASGVDPPTATFECATQCCACTLWWHTTCADELGVQLVEQCGSLAGEDAEFDVDFGSPLDPLKNMVTDELLVQHCRLPLVRGMVQHHLVKGVAGNLCSWCSLATRNP